MACNEDAIGALLRSVEADLSEVRIKLMRAVALERTLSVPLYRLQIEVDAGERQCRAIRAKRLPMPGRIEVRH